jgi:outer membrane receptor protein involved in Fe transport
MNQDLDLQKSHHFVLAYDWNINSFIRLKAETYYQYIFNAAVNAHEKDTYSVLNQGADFYVWNPDTLKSTGTGKNYGLELTFEHFLQKGFYMLSTASLFESKYKGSDGIERNTAFNSNFVFNLLLGKEWELHKNSSNPKLTSKKRRLGADVKLNWAGGRRYTPIDEQQSKLEHRPVYINDETFEQQFKNYFRTDIKVYFKHEGKKSNYEMGIDLQNIFNNQNIYSQNFNTSTGEIYYTYQLGIMVIPYVRFEF